MGRYFFEILASEVVLLEFMPPTINITSVANVPLVNGILPYATVAGADFAAYSGPSNTLSAFSGYVTSLSAATATSSTAMLVAICAGVWVAGLRNQ